MPECDYCSASFEDEGSYYDHLDAEHADELGAIDRRRVDQHLSEGSGPSVPTGPLILVAVLGFAVLVVVYVTVFVGGDTTGPSDTVNGIEVAQTPTAVNSQHLHGPIDVTIDGQQLDFSRPRFQRPQEYPAFHFEGGDGSTWHGHAEGITLQYAMATLGINVTDSTVTYDGTTYRGSDPDTSIEVTVDGEAVDPATYTLSGPGDVANAAEGDHIRIVVRTDE